MNLKWFNVSAPMWMWNGVTIKVFNLFNRVCADGDHYWGFGIVQIRNRHLFYVGHSGVSIFFIGKTP